MAILWLLGMLLLCTEAAYILTLGDSNSKQWDPFVYSSADEDEQLPEPVGWHGTVEQWDKFGKMRWKLLQVVKEYRHDKLPGTKGSRGCDYCNDNIRH